MERISELTEPDNWDVLSVKTHESRKRESKIPLKKSNLKLPDITDKSAQPRRWYGHTKGHVFRKTKSTSDALQGVDVAMLDLDVNVTSQAIDLSARSPRSQKKVTFLKDTQRSKTEMSKHNRNLNLKPLPKIRINSVEDVDTDTDNDDSIDKTRKQDSTLGNGPNRPKTGMNKSRINKDVKDTINAEISKRKLENPKSKVLDDVYEEVDDDGDVVDGNDISKVKTHQRHVNDISPNGDFKNRKDKWRSMKEVTEEGLDTISGSVNVNFVLSLYHSLSLSLSFSLSLTHTHARARALNVRY